jgi:bacillithiol system protein YtxJ
MSLPWKNITKVEELEVISDESYTTPVIIFKHSTSCSISAVAKNRLEGNTPATNEKYYYLDLLSYRAISNAIAERFKVHHESPQILLIKNGECVYEESHMDIRFDELQKQIAE